MTAYQTLALPMVNIGFFLIALRSLDLRLSILTWFLLGGLAQSISPAATPAPRIEQRQNQSPTAMVVSPTVSRGDLVTVSTRFADPDGVSDLGVVNILVNKYLDGVAACYLAYDSQSGWLHLVNDAGTGL